MRTVCPADVSKLLNITGGYTKKLSCYFDVNAPKQHYPGIWDRLFSFQHEIKIQGKEVEPADRDFLYVVAPVHHMVRE